MYICYNLRIFISFLSSRKSRNIQSYPSIQNIQDYEELHENTIHYYLWMQRNCLQFPMNKYILIQKHMNPKNLLKFNSEKPIKKLEDDNPRQFDQV